MNRQGQLFSPEIEQKIDRLLEQMTLEEKVGQLFQKSPSLFGAFGMTMTEIIEKMVDGTLTPEEFGSIDRDYHEDEIRKGKIGTCGGVTGSKKVNELQKIAVEESRLGIPLLFGLDVIHGYKTIFPIPLAESCSWEPELAKKSARIAAKEASAAGINWTFAPMVDIARDARWGRIAEGAGEDTYLGRQFARARVEGFQGENLTDEQSILACPKHFAAYGAATAGRDYNTVDMSMHELYGTYLPPFEAAAQAGAATFMCAFNTLNGVPCSANEFLLKKVLRERFGFKGFVVSDANSISECVAHGHAENKKQAAVHSITAGVDEDMSEGTYSESLIEPDGSPAVPMDVIDGAVRRVLRVKFAMGLFEHPYRTDEDREKRTILCAEHLNAARETARRSMVLLKNENRTLPLCRQAKRIAVVGPLADNQADILGSWIANGEAKDAVSVLSGIRQAVSSSTEVIYAKGCGIKQEEDDDLAQAVRAAAQSDVIVAVVGESADMSGEAASRLELSLPGQQPELLTLLKQTGKPLVVVLINGRPLAFPWVDENADAILEAWQPGTQGGMAVADILFGEYNPSGKLTVTMPYAVGQVPIYYNHLNTGRPAAKIRFSSKYMDGPCTPLYPFGYGLSYTTFEYSDIALSSVKMRRGEAIDASVEVRNTGECAGEEIVQLYLHDVCGSIARPVKELKGFQKIRLEQGESRRITFHLTENDLNYYNDEGECVLENGKFELFIGADSNTQRKADFDLI